MKNRIKTILAIFVILFSANSAMASDEISDEEILSYLLYGYASPTTVPTPGVKILWSCLSVCKLTLKCPDNQTVTRYEDLSAIQCAGNSALALDLNAAECSSTYQGKQMSVQIGQAVVQCQVDKAEPESPNKKNGCTVSEPRETCP